MNASSKWVDLLGSGWLGSRVVSVLDSGAVGPVQIAVATLLGNSLRQNCSHPSCLCSPSSKTGSSPLKGCVGYCRPGGRKVMAAYRRVYDSRHLQADPRTGISSGTLRSVTEYGLPVPFFTRVSSVQFMRREQTLRDQYSQVRKTYIIFFVQYAINYIYYDFSAIAKGRKLLSDMYT